MPLSSSNSREIRIDALFGSGNRVSNIEHLYHMSRLTDAASGQFPKGGDVDFSKPPVASNSPVTTTDKLKRRNHIDETRMVFENNLLLSKMSDHNTQDLRIKHGLSLVPAPTVDESLHPRKTNLGPRTKEAKRIDEANLRLGEHIRSMKSAAANNDALRASHDRHRALVSSISKFKPTLHNEPFVGATLMLREGGVDLLKDNPERWGSLNNSKKGSTVATVNGNDDTMNKSSRSAGSMRGSPRRRTAGLGDDPMESRYAPSNPWHHPSIEDLRQANLSTDRYYHRIGRNNADATTYTVHRGLGGGGGTPTSRSGPPRIDFSKSERLTRHHAKDAPEALHMDFTDHNHGTGRICSRGCMLPHHQQVREWRAVATARDAQRYIEHEQFSITNQLEIQRAAMRGEQPKIQYSEEAMRTVAKARKQTKEINAAPVTSPSVLFDHPPFGSKQGGFPVAYPPASPRTASHSQRVSMPTSMPPSMPTSPPTATGAFRTPRPPPSRPSVALPSIGSGRGAAAATPIFTEPPVTQGPPEHKLTVQMDSAQDPVIEVPLPTPAPVSPPPQDAEMDPEESPARPATQRARSHFSAHDADQASISPHQQQQRLLSRANFSSEVLVDDGRLYLFENVEYNFTRP